jgi:ParB family chromosome partitioning protein
LFPASGVLRAARLAGLGEVPCLIAGVDEETSSLLAMVENLQRRDLDFIGGARAIARLIENFGLPGTGGGQAGQIPVRRGQ